MKLFGLIAVLALTATGTYAQDPRSNLEKRFSMLPLEGNHDVPHTGWSDDYWPTQKGSINRRWNSPGQRGFNLYSPKKEQVLSMSQEEIAQLAPSEKFDILRGRYDYPLVKRVARNANPDAKDWAGICNGWAPASLNLKEPMAVTMTNADGVTIPFGSSDIKALLSFYYAYEVEAPTFQVGSRCWVGGGFSMFDSGCNDDLKAHTFHLIMSNHLGIKRQGFLADVDRLNEVWNQPITSYESTIISDRILSNWNGSYKGREVVMETKLHYGEEIHPNWNAVIGTGIQTYATLDLKYVLTLNSRDEVIGGKWLSWIRPDFLWFRGDAPFTGDFMPLGELYEAATQYKK